MDQRLKQIRSNKDFLDLDKEPLQTSHSKMFQRNSFSFIKRYYVLLFVYWITLNPVFGNVKLPRLFNDNMVLQREMRVPVLGWAEPGESVRVEIGERFDSASIHPLNKQEVGHLLYLFACKIAYCEKTLCNGSAFKSIYISGNKCILSFINIREGLGIKGSEKLKGFMISGADKKFFEADDVIEGDKVIVRINLVSYP